METITTSYIPVTFRIASNMDCTQIAINNVIHVKKIRIKINIIERGEGGSTWDMVGGKEVDLGKGDEGSIRTGFALSEKHPDLSSYQIP